MKKKDECESETVRELTRLIEELCGRSLTESERSGLQRAWSENCDAFTKVETFCSAEILTPLISQRGRRIGIVGVPSADGGVELHVRETGPVAGEVQHDA